MGHIPWVGLQYFVTMKIRQVISLSLQTVHHSLITQATFVAMIKISSAPTDSDKALACVGTPHRRLKYENHRLLSTSIQDIYDTKTLTTCKKVLGKNVDDIGFILLK